MLCVLPGDHHQAPKPPGMTKSEAQDFDNLRWRAIMKTTVECMANVHQYLVIPLEGLYWGTSSRGDLGAPTRARTTQTHSSPSRVGYLGPWVVGLAS